MSRDPGDPSSPEARLEPKGDGHRLVVLGRLDSRTVGRLWRETSRALAATPPAALVVDAAGIDYCDISGVGYLFDLRRRQKAAGKRFEIVNLRDDYGRLLAMFPDEEAAAAWTTGGLSFLAKGVWDRATSGNKICRKARKKAGFD